MVGNSGEERSPSLAFGHGLTLTKDMLGGTPIYADRSTPKIHITFIRMIEREQNINF
jgi:hypothetical protein